MKTQKTDATGSSLADNLKWGPSYGQGLGLELHMVPGYNTFSSSADFLGHGIMWIKGRAPDTKVGDFAVSCLGSSSKTSALWPDALQTRTKTFRIVLNNWSEESNVCSVLLFPVYGSLCCMMDIYDTELWAEHVSRKVELFFCALFPS